MLYGLQRRYPTRTLPEARHSLRLLQWHYLGGYFSALRYNEIAEEIKERIHQLEAEEREE